MWMYEVLDQMVPLRCTAQTGLLLGAQATVPEETL